MLSVLSDELLDNHRFASSSVSCEEDWLADADKFLDDVSGSHGVDGWDDELEEWGWLLRVFELRHGFFPVNELASFLIESVLEDSIAERDLQLGEEVSHHVVDEADC